MGKSQDRKLSSHLRKKSHSLITCSTWPIAVFHSLEQWLRPLPGPLPKDQGRINVSTQNKAQVNIGGSSEKDTHILCCVNLISLIVIVLRHSMRPLLNNTLISLRKRWQNSISPQTQADFQLWWDFLPSTIQERRLLLLKDQRQCTTTGTTDHIALLCCASAAGLPYPPMIIYAKSFPGGQYRFQGPDDALCGEVFDGLD